MSPERWSRRRNAVAPGFGCAIRSPLWVRTAPFGRATAANPFLDLGSGYVKRSLAELPKQGDRAPWRLHQNYVKDVRLLRRGPIDDDVVFAAAVAADRTNAVLR